MMAVSPLPYLFVKNPHKEDDVGLLLLDRDGVLIQSVERDGNFFGSARDVSEVIFTLGAKDFTKQMAANKVRMVVVTNQPDIAKGKIQLRQLEEMNQLIFEETEIDAIIVCPHDDTYRCKCRKPETLMLELAMETYSMKNENSILVGDRLKDLEAAERLNIPHAHFISDKNICNEVNHNHIFKLSDLNYFK